MESPGDQYNERKVMSDLVVLRNSFMRQCNRSLLEYRCGATYSVPEVGEKISKS